MRNTAIQQVTGILLLMYSATLLPPMAISWINQDGVISAFSWTCLVTLVIGFLIWLPVSRKKIDIRIREGFIIVALFWVLLSLISAIPLALTPNPDLSVTDALFEAVSGITTTGATVLTEIDKLPSSILYYRQQLQWIGGMGIIVLAVAVMPMLGIGGMQIYRSETPGATKDNKLTPRITETAKSLWYIYLGLTVACAISYHLAGMNTFDAISHAFSTISTGGFSTHDSNLGYFDNQKVYIVASIFMVLAGINFALHFMALRKRGLGIYARDGELRIYIMVLFVVSAITIGTLTYNNSYLDTQTTIGHGLFQAISIVTTTGYITTGYSWWPMFLPFMMIAVSFVGACAGSSSGGMKIIRLLLLYKQGVREIHRLIHPAAVIPIKVAGKPMDDQVIGAVWGFFSLYALGFCLLSLAMMATGSDIITAFSATAACLNNLGPGLGDAAQNYQHISTAGKWVLNLAMLLGRMEFFTLLVVLSSIIWRD
ncbi:MAG: TrkH family potassium uptake protein [Acidiferrobacterales bacterium]